MRKKSLGRAHCRISAIKYLVLRSFSYEKTPTINYIPTAIIVHKNATIQVRRHA